MYTSSKIFWWSTFNLWIIWDICCDVICDAILFESTQWSILNQKITTLTKNHNLYGFFLGEGGGDYTHIQKFKHSKNIGQQWRWDKKLSLSKVTSLKAVYAWSYLFTYFFLKKLHYCGHFFYTMNVCGT